MTGHLAYYYNATTTPRHVIQFSNSQDISGTQSRFSITVVTENGNQVMYLEYLEEANLLCEDTFHNPVHVGVS